MVKEGLINLDFADVRTIMAGMGKAMMGTGESSGDRRAIEAAEAAISNPLLDDVCMKGASGLLVSITGGNDLTLYEVDEAASRVRAEADPDANIIVGATFDDELDGSIRVSVVATGIGLAAIEALRPRSSKRRGARRAAGAEQAERAACRPRHAARNARSISTSRASCWPQSEVVKEPPVWRAPGNVTIEKRPAQATGIGLPLGISQPKPAPQAPSRPFQPAPPVAISTPGAAHAEHRGTAGRGSERDQGQVGPSAVLGLAAAEEEGGLPRAPRQCRPVPQGADAEMPAKREPEFGQAVGARRRQRHQGSGPEAPACRPASAAQRGIRIERPRNEQRRAAVPKRIEAQARPSRSKWPKQRANHLPTTISRFPPFCVAGRIEMERRR